MNDPTRHQLGRVLAFVAILEFLRSVVIYMFTSRCAAQARRLTTSRTSSTASISLNLQKGVEDHEKRMRTLESRATPITYQRYILSPSATSRLMNKKLDILPTHRAPAPTRR